MDGAYDLSYLTFVATQAALKAGEVLRKGFGSAYQITAKPGRQNIVTEYDHASEACIIALIRDHFPSHAIMAEESGWIDKEADDVLWIIDPLDGTTNFAHHLPLFTVSIAAYYKEIGLCGVVYQPLTNELFVAEKGKGSYLNGKRLTVSTTNRLEDALTGGGFPYNITEDPLPYLERLSHFARLGSIVRHLGSAALSLAYVAAGKLDGFWMDHLAPWDFAAGKVLIEEAGGKMTRYNGTAHQIKMSSNVLATNGLIHAEMLHHTY